MKLKKFIACLLSLALMLSVVGCAKEENTPTDTEPTTVTEAHQEIVEDPVSTTRVITDTKGREVEIPAEVDSIICLGPSTLRMVCYAQAQDRVVGIENYEQNIIVTRPYIWANKELAELPVVSEVASGSGLTPYEEEILKVNPDCILISYSDIEVGESLQNKLQIPVVFVSSAGAIFSEDMYASMMVIGEILGKEERCQEVVTYLKGLQTDLEARVAGISDEEKPGVYLGAASFGGAHGFEGSIANYPPFLVAGINNLTNLTGEKRNVLLDMEVILEWDPDIIFLNAENMNLVNEQYKENPNYFNSLTAVKEGKVYSQIAYNTYGCNLELAICNAYYAASIVYPERFEDIDIGKMVDDVCMMMLGQPFYADLEAAGCSFNQVVIGE